MLRGIYRRKGGALRASWLILAGVAAALLLSAIPARAESPCDSPTVIPDGSEALRSDCEAVWEFYTGLEDPGVLDDADNPNAWLPSIPFVEWQGLVVQSDVVVVISLSDAKLKGPVSPRLGGLRGLRALHLNSNQLTGPIPPELGDLSKLAVLQLDGNGFTGPIPPEIGQLAELVYLLLHSNDLTGPIPAQVGDLTDLKWLYLLGNELSGPIPDELGRLHDLEILALGDNQLTGSIPPELGKLVNLTVLTLNANQLTGSIPPELGKLVNLTVLALNGNQLTGSIPPELESLAKLEQLLLRGNRLTGPIPPGLEPLLDPADKDEINPYWADPLGLIAHADYYRQYSLGTTVWHVWFCEVPLGDAPVVADEVERRLNREVAAYFEWVSGGRYRPSFQAEGWLTGDSRSDCRALLEAQEPELPVLLVETSPANDGYAAGRGLVVLGGGTVVQTPGFRQPRLSTVVHEMGHALGFPHSYGGRIRWSPEGQLSGVYEYDNPMDMMSGDLSLGLLTGTIASNRYAAGWIEPDEVAIHAAGTTAVYELRPPGAGGTQMLVLPGRRQGMFTALGARVALGYDAAIPRAGVEAYRIDQREAACTYPWRGACSGTERRTQPYPPAEPGAGYGDDLHSRGWGRLVNHVYRPGDVFEIGKTMVEVVEKAGNNYRVRVVDSSAPPPPPAPAPGPSFDGRFSDDDGNFHEADIETIARLGITQGCNPPDNDRYCPSHPVTRAQMAAFLSRALGEMGAGAPTVSRFSDVPEGAWYLGYVESLAESGVFPDVAGSPFRPSDPLTRIEMAVWMAGAFEGITEVEPQGIFADVAADAWYAGAVEGLRAAGVTDGCKDEPLAYCPDEQVSRAQMASFLARALKAG